MRGVSPARLIHAALAVAAVGACLATLGVAREMSELALYPIVALVAGANLVLLARLKPRGIWSATTVYLGVYTLFHLGLVAVVGLRGVPLGSLTEYIAGWFLRPQAREAAMLSLAGMFAVTAGSYLPSFLVGDPVERPAANEAPGAGDQAANRVGALLVIGSVLLWFWVTWRSGGLLLLFASYSAYLEAVESQGNIISVIWFLFGFGAVLLMTAGPGRWRTAGLAWFYGFCAIGLPIGLRGEVMFPLAASFVARAQIGRGLARRTTALLIVGGLIVIVAVKQIRQVGLSDLGAADDQATVFDAFVELGGSLQPVEKVVTWREYGDALAGGATYWAPIDRSLYYLIPGWTRPPADEDERIMNVVIFARAGGIGFSPVAEAYRNFGRWGVPAVLFLIGVLLGALERLGSGLSARLLIAVLFVPLMINVRNSFTPVPAQIFLGVLLAAGVFVLATFLRRNDPPTLAPGGAVPTQS